MPDSISNFREIRVTLYPSEVSPQISWLVNLVTTRKGVPVGSTMDRGLIYFPDFPHTTEGVIRALHAFDHHIGERWTLS